MSHFKFNLGDEVKDSVTGVTGIVSSKTEFLNGCKRYGLEQPQKKDGSIPDVITVDEQQLLLVKALKVNVGQPLNGEPKKAFTGGPKPAPARSRMSKPKAFGR